MNKIPVTRTENVKKNAIAGFIYTLVTTVFPFIIRTLTIRYLGEDFLGLSSFCLSVLEVLNVANLGIDSALQFHLYEPISDNNKEKIEQLIFFYKKVYHAIGFTILIAGIISMPFLSKFIKCDMPEGIDLYLVFCIFLISQVNGYLLNSTTALFIKANQESYILSVIYIISSILVYLTQIAFIINSLYYGYVIALLGRSVLDALALFFLRRIKYDDINFNKTEKSIPTHLKQRVIADTLNVAIYRIRNISRNSFDSIIISSIMGLRILARYQNYYTVLQVPIMIKTILINSVTASFGDYKVSNDIESTYSLFRMILFIYFILSGWCSIFYYILIQDFISAWVGPEFLLSNSTALLFAIYIFLLGFGSFTNMLRSAFGIWNKGKTAAFIEMASNILLNIGLAYLMGVGGIVLATVLTMALIFIPYELYVISDNMFIGKLRDIIRIIFIYVLWTVLTGIIVVYICKFVPKIALWGFFIKALIGVVVPIVTFMLFFGKSSLCKSVVSNIFVRSNRS